MGLDIGPKTLSDIQAGLADCKTVIWNGPMGTIALTLLSSPSLSSLLLCVVFVSVCLLEVPTSLCVTPHHSLVFLLLTMTPPIASHTHSFSLSLPDPDTLFLSLSLSHLSLHPLPHPLSLPSSLSLSRRRVRVRRFLQGNLRHRFNPR